MATDRYSQQTPELTMKLDGVLVSFTLGETIYEVAVRHGKSIPTLCYDPRLKPFGACRLCAVEIKGARPVASCTALAQLDIEVITESERIDRHRKTLLELVASENGGAVTVEPLRGYASQELCELVDRFDARTDRFGGACSGHSKEDDNPFILRDYDKCISCYRCVRVCAEQEGDYAISVMNRGFYTRITVEFDGPLRKSACTFCGQCVQTCPTGALGDKKALRFVEETANG